MLLRASMFALAVVFTGLACTSASASFSFGRSVHGKVLFAHAPKVNWGDGFQRR
jgi:hypothetical protein